MSMTEKNQTEGGASCEQVRSKFSIDDLVPNKYAGYVCFRTHDLSSGVKSVRVYSGDVSFNAWLNEVSVVNENFKSISDEDSDSVENSKDVENKLLTLLRKARESVSSYYLLTTAVSSFMPALRTSYASGLMYSEAKKRLNHYASEDGVVDVFGIEPSKYYLVSRQIRKLKELDNSMDVIPSAVFINLVSTYDSLVEELLRYLIDKYPDKIENSSKTMTVKEILSLKDFDELKSNLINDELDSIMRGSHADQVSVIEQYIGLKISDSYERWSEFVEIFERRNIAVHGNLTVNKFYLNNCKKAKYDVSGISIGDKLDLDQEYLYSSITILLEFIILLLFTVWRKLDPANLQSHISVFADETYELMVDNHSLVVSRVLEFITSKQNLKFDQQYVMMMTINLAISFKKLGKDECCNRILDTVEWKTLSDEYVICVSAIREDIDSVCRIMPIAVSANKITKDDLYSWAAFDWVRENPKFQDAFKDIFDEVMDDIQGVRSFGVAFSIDNDGI